MADKFNFIVRSLDALPAPTDVTRKDYYDTQVRGLSIRVTQNGAKTFYVRRKIEGRSERILVGRYPDVSIEQARKKAADVLSQIGHGENPQEKRRAAKEEPTLREAFENYLEGHAKSRCVRVIDMREDFRRYLSDWADRQLRTISRTDVQDRVTKVHRKNGPSAANHMIILMKATMNWNAKHGFYEGANGWTAVKQFKIQSRERFLRPEEMQRFFSALEQLDSELMRDYILLSLYTGARRANVLAMRWDQVDLNLGLWRIPLTKNKESQTIPLTRAAREILERRSEARTSAWVLPGKSEENHLMEPKRAWAKLLEKAEIDDLRLHDLRRTLGSYMAMGNNSLQIIGKALGHKSSQATEIYSRLTNDAVLEAMEKAQSNIQALAGITTRDDNTSPKSHKKSKVSEAKKSEAAISHESGTETARNASLQMSVDAQSRGKSKRGHLKRVK